MDPSQRTLKRGDILMIGGRKLTIVRVHRGSIELVAEDANGKRLPLRRDQLTGEFYLTGHIGSE